MNAKSLLATGVVLLILAPIRADDQSKLTPEKLVGTWSYVSGEKDGNKVDEDGLKKASVVITKDKITLKGEQGEFVLKYQLDNKKSPCAIALEITEGLAGAVGSKSEGIIELKDDTLKLCYPPMGGKPPAEFSGKQGSGNHYFVLKRKK
jgi:uncharacterized protein (TIGR03067 family)